MPSIDFGPVVYPTENEFQDFLNYIISLEQKFSAEYGIVKIVPPKSFKPRSLDYDKSIENFLLQGPIEQNIYGKGGIYELLFIQKKSATLSEYKKRVCCFDNITHDKNVEEIENLFWKNITFSPPLYGADIKGSLMNTNHNWNLGKLSSLLSKGLNEPLSGVNVPYMYVGSWKTMFGWHKEDLDLSAINYVHHGKSKFWYGLPVKEAVKLESFAKRNFGEGFSKCGEFMRHKTTMISPYVLKKADPSLIIHKMVQNPGEFVITFGGAYHAGFNYGFNIAEAVNFATPNWLNAFINAKSCTCVRDSVKIDKEIFLKNLLNSEFKNFPEVKEFAKNIQIKKKLLAEKLAKKSEGVKKKTIRKSRKRIRF